MKHSTIRPLLAGLGIAAGGLDGRKHLPLARDAHGGAQVAVADGGVAEMYMSDCQPGGCGTA